MGIIRILTAGAIETGQESSQTSTASFGWASSEKGLYLLVVLSFALKGILFGLTEIISNDGPKYINPAYAFLEGNWLEAVKSSGTFLYSLLIAAFGRLGFDLVLAGELISLASSVLVLIPLYRFFSGVANRNVAFWGCLAFAFSPRMNKFSVAVMRDPLFLLVYAWLVYFFWRALEEKKIRYFVWVSLLSILSPLLRLEGLLFVPLFFLILAVRGFSDFKGRKPLLKGAGIFLAVWIFLSSSGFLVLSRGDLSTSGPGRVKQVEKAFEHLKERGLFFAHPVLTEKLNKMEQEIPGGVSGNDFAEVARNHIFLIYFIGLVSVIAQNLWLPFFLALLLGLSRLSFLGKGRSYILCLVIGYSGMAYWYSINYGFLDERYVYVPVMLLCVVVGLGLERITQFLQGLPIDRLVLSCLLLSVVAVPAVEAVKREAKPGALSARQAGEWLTEQPELHDCTLLSNGEKIPFYAGRRGAFIHAEFWSMSRLKAFVSSNDADLIAFETRKSKLGDDLSFPGYRLIAKFEDKRYDSLIFRREQ